MTDDSTFDWISQVANEVKELQRQLENHAHCHDCGCTIPRGYYCPPCERKRAEKDQHTQPIPLEKILEEEED